MNQTEDPRLIAFKRLLDIMDDLREKCPWDKKQTFQSLSMLTIEEVYELTDAIEEANYKHISEELGDLFLHLVFYAKLGQEINAFDVSQVLNQVCEKLIHRHPHIYGDVKVQDEDEVKRNWEQLKMKEGRKSLLSGVPNSLSAMIKAYRIQEKVKQVGFEWKNIEDVWLKVEEEMQELSQAVDSKIGKKIDEEFGDLLFALINYARFLHLDPEASLQRTNKKFMNRFMFIEKHADKPLEEMSLEEMEVLWQKAKTTE